MVSDATSSLPRPYYWLEATCEALRRRKQATRMRCAALVGHPIRMSILEITANNMTDSNKHTKKLQSSKTH
jgi:hypothetical protein